MYMHIILGKSIIKYSRKHKYIEIFESLNRCCRKRTKIKQIIIILFFYKQPLVIMLRNREKGIF